MVNVSRKCFLSPCKPLSAGYWEGQTYMGGAFHWAEGQPLWAGLKVSLSFISGIVQWQNGARAGNPTYSTLPQWNCVRHRMFSIFHPDAWSEDDFENICMNIWAKWFGWLSHGWSTELIEMASLFVVNHDCRDSFGNHCRSWSSNDQWVRWVPAWLQQCYIIQDNHHHHHRTRQPSPSPSYKTTITIVQDNEQHSHHNYGPAKTMPQQQQYNNNTT